MVAPLLAAVLLAFPPPPAPGNSVSVTVYSTADVRGFDPQQFVEQQRAGWDPQSARSVPGFGVVRETRRMTIPKGTGWVSFSDVAQFMDPSTVLFTDLDDPATRVLEQRLEFDLVNGEKLLQKYLDRTVTLETTAGNQRLSTTGRLLSANGGQAVLQTDSGVVILPSTDATVRLGDLPGGLRVKPSLLWNTESPSGGEHAVRVDYQTGGITWRADYNLSVNPDEATAALAAWVSLLNVSGTGYKDAELRLVAGNVRRIQEQRMLRRGGGGGGFGGGGSEGFVEETIGENHRYTLGRRIDLPSNSTQQLTLFPTVPQLKVRKELVVELMGNFGYGAAPNLSMEDGTVRIGTVQVWFVFQNTETDGLGIPLPTGKVRVTQQDASGGGEFVGEDVIGHTPRGQTVRLNIGTSFDVTAERKRMDFSVDSARRQAQETVQVTLKNGKTKPETVLVREGMWRWSTWTLEKATLDGKPVEPTKESASLITQQVTVPADGESIFTYTVRYQW